MHLINHRTYIELSTLDTKNVYEKFDRSSTFNIARETDYAPVMYLYGTNSNGTFKLDTYMEAASAYEDMQMIKRMISNLDSVKPDAPAASAKLDDINEIVKLLRDMGTIYLYDYSKMDDELAKITGDDSKPATDCAHVFDIDGITKHFYRMALDAGMFSDEDSAIVRDVLGIEEPAEESSHSFEAELIKMIEGESNDDESEFFDFVKWMAECTAMHESYSRHLLDIAKKACPDFITSAANGICSFLKGEPSDEPDLKTAYAQPATGRKAQVVRLVKLGDTVYNVPSFSANDQPRKLGDSAYTLHQSNSNVRSSGVVECTVKLQQTAFESNIKEMFDHIVMTYTKVGDAVCDLFNANEVKVKDAQPVMVQTRKIAKTLASLKERCSDENEGRHKLDMSKMSPSLRSTCLMSRCRAISEGLATLRDNIKSMAAIFPEVKGCETVILNLNVIHGGIQRMLNYVWSVHNVVDFDGDICDDCTPSFRDDAAIFKPGAGDYDGDVKTKDHQTPDLYPEEEACNIFDEITKERILHGIKYHEDYMPNVHKEIVCECVQLLNSRLMLGEYTLVEYAAICDALIDIIDDFPKYADQKRDNND